MAALALLVTLAIPMGMWGQSDYSSDYTGNITLSADGGTNASACRIIISNTEYDGIKAGTSSKVGAVRITVPSGTKYLHIHAAAWNNTTCSLDVTPTGYSDAIALTANSGIANNTPFTFNGDASTSDYYKVITFSSALTSDTELTFTATGGKRFVIWGVTSEEEGTPAAVATPTFNPASGTEFDDEGLSVEISCATENTTIYYTLDGSEPDDESTEYTEAISLTETTTIKAIAFDSDDNTSAVATATYTYVDPNQPGTQANPYTVVQARAAIDAGTGTQGVYATGIVSSIPTAWNSQYSNITFNFVDNAGDTEFLQAYRCKSSSTANASEVQVGDVVVVYGNLKNYNGTYEFDANCQLVSLTHPSILAPAFSIAAGGYAEAQSVELSCETPNAVIYYTLDGSDPTSASAQYNGAISVTETTTIKAIAYVGAGNSPVAEATYYILSSDNVYTVTEALAFTSYPQNNIFVSGIVSTAPENLISGAQLTYYISVDGEAANELEVYKGRGLNNADFTSVDDIQLGDIVTVFGNVQEYQGTIEFGSGNYLVTFERPDAPVVPSITVADATVSVPADGAEGTLTVTYENFTEIIADVYFCNAEGETATYEWITAEINDDNNVEYLVEANEGEARTAYFKVYALDDNAEYVYSNLVTINQAEYVVPALDYAELPFEFDGGRADIENTDGLTQEGLDTDYSSSPKLKFNTTGDWLLLHFNEQPGTLTFDIKGNSFSGGTFTVQTSEDGETYTDLKTYTELGDTQHESFTNLGENVRYIKWIYTEKVSGNVGLGNIALAEYTEPQQYTLTVEPFENLELITFVNEEMVMEGDGEITVTEGDEIMLSVVVLEGYEMETLMVNGVNHVDDIAEDYTYTFVMPAENVTISATAVEDVPPTPGNMYVKVTSTNDLTSGQYLIVYEEGNVAFNGGLETLDAAGNTIDVTIQDDEIAVTTETAAAEFTIDMAAGTIMSASGLYIGQTSDANGMQSSVETAYTNTISIDEDYNAVVVSSSAHLRYNNASNQNRFRYYKSASYEGQKAIQLYKKVETLPANSIVIEGYGESEGGYYLIASPFTVSPEDVQGMTEGEYDLYSFDEAEENEWRNYKAGAFTNLEPGKGYLYAHSTTVTLTFDGEAYNGDPIVLKKTTGGDFPGWNLVGNPYTETAYIDRDFYVMNPETGGEIITGEGNEIAAMQGFFVIAANDGEELEISTTAPAEQGGKIVMNVSNGRSSVIDRAMVRFGEGRTLPKFMLNDENTKIYITEGNEEFAVVRSINENVTPVSFHAAENGTYTLSVNAENVDFSFFHLIDNMTGNDIDLLSTPSYTFEASTTDYAQRFSLLYATLDGVGENNAGAFAFFNGNEWVVNNEGEANLQVIDMTGRLISSETVNGTATVSLNQSAGIYMLRLVNGNNVKVQKVVVR